MWEQRMLESSDKMDWFGPRTVKTIRILSLGSCIMDGVLFVDL